MKLYTRTLILITSTPVHQGIRASGHQGIDKKKRLGLNLIAYSSQDNIIEYDLHHDLKHIAAYP